MSATVFLPPNLSHLAKGKDSFEVNGETADECLKQLVERVPEIKKALFYGSGRLDPTIKVLVNGESVDAEGLAGKLADGDEIYIKLNRH